jgi:dTDP-4-dehydrorhamnose reductase
MRILLTGDKGMLGQDLAALLAPRHEIIPLDLPTVDITDAEAVDRYVSETRPEATIHAAAFTDVDGCERLPDTAFRVNAAGTQNVAVACRKAGIPMLYVSTDYVFDGEKPAPYLEGDLPNPLNVYGKSKLVGEKAVQDSLAAFWVVRTSWLFGPKGKNFVRAIIDRAKTGEELRVVNDQIGAPTYTAHLAGTLEQILTRGGPGIYHATNQGYCSWFEFAQAILAQAGWGHIKVIPISTAASGRIARRPRNSRLANTRLQEEGLSLLPSWQEGLRCYLKRESGTIT